MVKLLHECLVVHEGSIPETPHVALSHQPAAMKECAMGSSSACLLRIWSCQICEAHLRAESAMTGPQTSGRSARGLSSGCTTPLTCNGVVTSQLCGLMHRCPADNYRISGMHS